ncbi:MAG: thiamine-phosphate kinase [Candidatus Heimdallarchaeota archaeon]|nr:thiamine-phosphate kinase [Candidatus Heimdallarchaeota archaeon]
MNRKPKRVMSDIGERQFLLEIANLVSNPVLGFNDDASAIQLSEDTILVINADMLVKQTDVLPGMTYNQIGRKAVTMSVSDIVAKGVNPLGCLASVAFPEDLEVESAKKIIEGIKDQCSEYNIQYLGGDLNEGIDIIVDAISFGTCSKESLIPRVGAEVGDILYTTGYFGLTSLGFQFLLGNINLNDELKHLALESVYNPKAKIQYLSLFQKIQVKICMDSSDGLFITLNDLSKLNGMGIEISKLPIHPNVSDYAKEWKQNPLELVFSGGEEFELVFAISPDKEHQLIKEAQKQNLELQRIGSFSDKFEGIKITDEEYRECEIPKGGYEHFSSFHS